MKRSKLSEQDRTKIDRAKELEAESWETLGTENSAEAYRKAKALREDVKRGQNLF